MSSASRTLRSWAPTVASVLLCVLVAGWGLAVQPQTARATVPVACPDITIVEDEDPVGCDLDGSQLLIVTGVTALRCDAMGGIYRSEVRGCLDVDH